MLLDAKHRPWILAVGVAAGLSTLVYVPYHLKSPNGASGASVIGISFGMVAFLLMLFAGLLGARRRFPAWRLGRPEHWMRGHLWLGLLCVPLVFFHAGFRLGGALTTTLTVLLVLVTLSGIFGFILQQVLPRLMMSRVPMETIFEQIGHVLVQLREEADGLVAGLTGPLGIEAPPPDPAAPIRKPAAPAQPAEGSEPLKDFYLRKVRPFLDPHGIEGPLSSGPKSSALFLTVRALLPPALHDPLKDLEIICEERRQLAKQRRLQRWLQGWLLVHIPLSYALLALSAAHAVGSVRY